MPAPTLPIALQAHAGSSQLYMTLTVESIPFYFGGISYNVPGGARLHAVVNDWGDFRKFLSQDGRDRTSEVEVQFHGNATMVGSTTTTIITFLDFLRRYQLRDTPVSVYQTNNVANVAELIWSGYWQGVSGYATSQGLPLVTVRFSEREAALQTVISDVIDLAGFPNALEDFRGEMVQRVYGQRFSPDVNKGVFYGWGTPGVRGQIIDVNQTLLKRKVRFAKNDGSYGALDAATEAAHSDSPHERNDLFLWLPGMGTYATVDPASWVPTNDTSEVAATIDAQAIIYVRLRLGSKGSMGHAALDSSLYKVTDLDPSNYIETTNTDYQIAFQIPAADLPGMRILAVWAMVNYSNNSGANRDVEYGIWDDYNTGAAGWLGNTNSRTQFPGIVTGTTLDDYTPQYTATMMAAHVGNSTRAEFAEGRFIGRDTNNVETPLQFLFRPYSANKNGVRLKRVAIIAKAQIELDRMVTLSRVVSRERLYTPKGEFKHKYRDVIEAQEVSVPQMANDQHEFIMCGSFQKDGTGTYQGAGECIRKGPSIAHHLIAKIGGLTCNTTTGTLGNFTDAKVEEVAGEQFIDPTFGPDPVTLGAALADLQSRHPIRLHEEQGIWQCIPDHINPHSSRLYRSSSDIRRISARRHIIGGTIGVRELDWALLRNQVTINYGHSYGEARAMNTYTVDNPLSQELFGVRKYSQPIDEPWIEADSPGGDVQGVLNLSARYLGQHRTRVAGRPRLTVSVKLSQELYDLQRGHIVEFDTDMEGHGFGCPAYRCGFYDYIFFRADASSSNQAMNTSVTLVPAASITSELMLGASQQLDGFQCTVNNLGIYTVINNAWEYYNGSAWVAHSGVTATRNGVAIDPDDAFLATGDLVVSWTRPTPTSWKKAEITIASVNKGPCYWTRFKYNTATDAALGTGIITYPARWYGRLFEVIEVTRKPGSSGDYAYLDAVLQEVM